MATFQRRGRRNPLKIRDKDLEYFNEVVLQPHFSENKTTAVDIGQGRKVTRPRQNFKQTTLTLPETFEFQTSFKNPRTGRGTDTKHVWKPKDMFLGQNNKLKQLNLKPKFEKKAVKQRVKAATKMPKLTFALEPVELIKPKYGNSLLKKLM